MIFGYSIRPAAALGSRFGPYISGGLGAKPVSIRAEGYTFTIIQIRDRLRVAVLRAPERVGVLGRVASPIVITEVTRIILGAFPATTEIVVTTRPRSASRAVPNRNLQIVDAARIAAILGHTRTIGGSPPTRSIQT